MTLNSARGFVMSLISLLNKEPEYKLLWKEEVVRAEGIVKTEEEELF